MCHLFGYAGCQNQECSHLLDEAVSHCGYAQHCNLCSTQVSNTGITASISSRGQHSRCEVASAALKYQHTPQGHSTQRCSRMHRAVHKHNPCFAGVSLACSNLQTQAWVIHSPDCFLPTRVPVCYELSLLGGAMLWCTAGLSHGRMLHWPGPSTSSPASLASHSATTGC